MKNMKEALKKVLKPSEGEYHDHSHCWTSKYPPCGQKIEHLKCCLCEKVNPKARNLVNKTPEDFSGKLESIKHVGHWVDGKLVCDTDCPSVTHKFDTPEVAEWEKEFDKVFGNTLGLEEGFNSVYIALHVKPALKSFITSLLTSHEEKVRADWLRSEIEKLEGMIREKDYPADTQTMFYNQALTSIITRYKEELKGLIGE